jgi:electron transport complex protein RnfG
MSGDTKAPGAAPSISSLRLLGTMGGAGALAGFLIVIVYQFTLPSVLANRAARLENAILQVVPGSTRYDTLYLVDGVLTPNAPTGPAAKTVEKIYAAFDSSGERKGFAVPAGAPGFADTVDVLFGFNPERPGTLGLAILNSRETPGLGDKIEAPAWLQQFGDAQTPITGVKAGNRHKPDDIEMITGATISSRTVIAAINNAVARWKPIIDAYRAGGKS